LEQHLGITAGVVIGPVRPGALAYGVGHSYGGSARSTIKVPISHAVMMLHGGFNKTPQRFRNDIRAAIRRSDNDATTRLFNSLGSRERAANRVQRQLRTAGDRRTHVIGFPWGATHWTLRDQQRFAAGLSCLKFAKPLIKEMRRITSSQRWGLGRLPRRPAFKGGWGTGSDGKVRQLGLIELAPGKHAAVALFANAHNSSFESAKRGLSAVARWTKRRVVAGRLAEPSCDRR
jgi:hypothetical protein